MGRRRTHNLHLPPRLRLISGTYWFTPRVNGKQVWINFGRDYGQALQRWASETGKTVAISTVADAIGAYLETQRDRLKPSTMEGYQKSAKRLLPVFGSVGLQDLEASDVYRYMIERGDVSANRDRALLSAAYTHARRTGAHKGDDPTKLLQFRNAEKPRERLITDAELARLVEVANPRMALIIRFAALTGMRQGDILGLKLTAAGPEGITYRTGKTGKSILLEWTPELRAIWQAAAKDRVGAVTVFTSEDRKPFTGSGFRASWRRVKERAGLLDVRFHDLRGKAGTEHPDAQKLLGHTNSSVTERHYKRGPVRARPVK